MLGDGCGGLFFFLACLLFAILLCGVYLVWAVRDTVLCRASKSSGYVTHDKKQSAGDSISG